MDNSSVTPPSAHSPRASAPSLAAQAGRLAGAVGIVLLASAPLTYLLADTGPLLGFKVLAGLCGIVAYGATNRDFLRGSRGGRSNALLLVSALTTTVTLGLVAGVNGLAARHDHEWDCTREKIFTLSPQTTELLGRLPQPVEVYAFYGSQEPAYAVTEETLTRYAKHSQHLEVHMVDPQSRPDLVKKYNITERGARIVLVTAGRDARAKQASEEELTEALLKVVESSSKTVTFLLGHGEGDTAQSDEAEGFAALAQAIAADGYRIDTLNLQTLVPEGGNDAEPMPAAVVEEARNLEVPSSVDVLAVLAPVHKLLAPEVQAIEAYLARGGRLLVMEEARGLSGLAALLADYHVDVRDDMVVDTNPIGRLLGLGVASPLIGPTDTNHPILRGLSGAIMSTARSLSEGAGKVSNVKVTPLMQTGETAWGETQLAQGSTLARDANDHLPPLYTAMAAEVLATPPAPGATPAPGTQAAAPTARLVVFGDSDWASNKLLRLQSNEDLALNALGWLTEQDAKVTIRPNVRAQSQLYLTGEQLTSLKFLSMDIVPVLLVAFGLGIVMLRRQR